MWLVTYYPFSSDKDEISPRVDSLLFLEIMSSPGSTLLYIILCLSLPTSLFLCNSITYAIPSLCNSITPYGHQICYDHITVEIYVKESFISMNCLSCYFCWENESRSKMFSSGCRICLLVTRRYNYNSLNLSTNLL